MRSNYTPALRQRVEEHPRRARLMVEAHAELQAHIRHRKDQWEQADVNPDANGFDYLPDEGLVLDASTLSTILEQTTTDASTHLLLNRPPGGGEYDTVRIDWRGSQPSDLAVRQLTLKLNPDTGAGQEVVTWKCLLMAMTRQTGDGTALTTHYELTPLHEAVSATAGASSGDVAFNFSTFLPRPLLFQPEGDSAPNVPVTFVFVWGVKADGALARNTGLLSGGGSLTTGSPIAVSGARLVDSNNHAGSYEITNPAIDVPRIKIESGSYTAATVTWSTNPFDLGAAPRAEIASETFPITGGNQNIDVYSAPTAIGGYGHNGASGDVIVDDAEDAARFTHNDQRWVRVDNALIPSSYEFDLFWQAKRNGVDGTTELCGVHGYIPRPADVTDANLDGEGFEVYHVRGSSATVANLVFNERNSSGTAIGSGTLATGLSWATGASRYGWAAVRGLTVTVYDRADPADAWEVRGSFTLTTDWRDGFHGHVGLTGKDGSQASSSEPMIPSWSISTAVSPPTAVEFTLFDETPEGSTITGEVRNDADTAWVTFNDGDLDTDLTDVSPKQTYKIRVTLTPNAAGNLTPVLRAVGVREISILDVSDTSEVVTRGLGFSLPKLEGQPENVTIKILKDGIPDWEDFASRIASEFTVSEVYFRVFIGADDLTRSQWMLRWEGVMLDQHGEAGAIVFDCVCPLALLDAQIPKAVDTGGGAWQWQHPTWNPASYQTIYEALIDTWGELPTRHRGPGVTSSTSITRTITRGEVREAVNQIARTQGQTVFSSQGRVIARDVFASGGIKAFFPLEEITQGFVTPGYQQRIPRYVVPFNYDEARGEFDDIIVRTHGSSLLAFRRVPLKPEDRADDDFAKWIQDSTTATNVAQRVVDTQGIGMVAVPFHSKVAHPHLEPGDRVGVITDRLAIKDPNDATRQLKGELACLGVVMEQNDIWGHDFMVWVQDLNDIFSASATGVDDGVGPRFILQIPYASFVRTVTGTADYTNNDLRSTGTSEVIVHAVLNLPFGTRIHRMRMRTYTGDGVTNSEIEMSLFKSTDGTSLELQSVTDLDNRDSWATTAWNSDSLVVIDETTALFLQIRIDPSGPADASKARFLWGEIEFGR